MDGGKHFNFYDKHYQRVLNIVPDWNAGEEHPVGYACCKPWLPVNKEAKILDFGCGWGQQLLSLWCAGYRNIEGVELVREQALIATKAANNRVLITCMDGRDFLADKNEYYDLIILNDVLEHIPVSEQVPLLTLLRRALVSGGSLVVRVPNASSIANAFSRYSDITHTTAFTEISLMQILDLAGFVNHKVLPDNIKAAWREWRPWRPWRGLAIRAKLNYLLHKIVYFLRGQSPKPTVFDYNVEVYTYKE